LVLVLLWLIEERGMGLELVMCWLSGGWDMILALVPCWLGERLGEAEAPRKIGVPEVEMAKVTVMTVRRVEDTMVELKREKIWKIEWRRQDSGKT
jgi:hypothetical protein